MLLIRLLGISFLFTVGCQNIKDKEGLFKDKAVYDLLKDSWLAKPEHPSIFLNDPEVMENAARFQEKINSIINHEGSIENIKKLRDEIKDMRQKGLEEEGEFSVGNLTFKALRHSGYIKKLYDYKAKIQDAELSLENFKLFFKNSFICSKIFSKYSLLSERITKSSAYLI